MIMRKKAKRNDNAEKGKKTYLIALIPVVAATVIPRVSFLQNFISRLNESRIRFKLRNG